MQIRERLLAAQAAGSASIASSRATRASRPPAHVLDAITQAAHAGKTHYVPNNGIPELRRALAHKVAEKNGLTSVDRRRHLRHQRRDARAVRRLRRAALDAGDEVIIPDPMWTEVAENIRLAGGVPVGVPLQRRATTSRIEPDDIAAAITPRTTAIFLNTPHNPTGAVLSRDELRGDPRARRDATTCGSSPTKRTRT